jgi:hypothetical protein
MKAVVKPSLNRLGCSSMKTSKVTEQLNKTTRAGLSRTSTVISLWQYIRPTVVGVEHAVCYQAVYKAGEVIPLKTMVVNA